MADTCFYFDTIKTLTEDFKSSYLIFYLLIDAEV